MTRTHAILALSAAAILASAPATADETQTVKPNAGRATYTAPAVPTAQSGPMAFNPEQRLAKLTERLKLTPEQQVSIKPILEDAATQVNAARASNKNPKSAKEHEAVQAKVKRILKDSNGQIEALLTDDQKAEWIQMKNETLTKSQVGLQADKEKPPGEQP